MVGEIPAGDGKIVKLFLQCILAVQDVLHVLETGNVLESRGCPVLNVSCLLSFTVKKRLSFFPSPAGMSLTFFTLFQQKRPILPGIDQSIDLSPMTSYANG